MACSSFTVVVVHLLSSPFTPLHRSSFICPLQWMMNSWICSCSVNNNSVWYFSSHSKVQYHRIGVESLMNLSFLLTHSDHFRLWIKTNWTWDQWPISSILRFELTLPNGFWTYFAVQELLCLIKGEIAELVHWLLHIVGLEPWKGSAMKLFCINLYTTSSWLNNLQQEKPYTDFWKQQELRKTLQSSKNVL
jgi:hypothetical protein